MHMVIESNCRERQIATVWHPSCDGLILETKLGNVRVLQGPAQYQLTSGEIIEI